MPIKGIRSLCLHSKTPSLAAYSSSPSRLSAYSSSPSRPSVSFPTPRRFPVENFTDAINQQIIDNAAVLVMKWNPDTSTYAKVTSLFYESKNEARQFIRCVTDLQIAMHYLVQEDPTSEKLVQAQSLMQVAMKRLQKEFYQILSMNREHLDPESVSTRSRSSIASTRSSISDDDEDRGATTDDDVKFATDAILEVEQVSAIAMNDLKLIAECMITSGYSKECVHIYKIIRKSIIDEGIYKLGVERFSSSQIGKMDREVLDLRYKSWLNTVKISISTLFNGERILCDHVFSSSASIRESCFTDISREAATLLFGFPQVLVAVKSKKNSLDIFRLLDMYTAISENWPEIESIFGFESTAAVRSQALNSLIKLSESVLSLLSDFESMVQKDSSKSVPTGGGIHDLTLRAMNYLSLLTDYSNVLADIITDWPPPAKSSHPKSYFDSPVSDEAPAPAISARMAWLVLVLLCKLNDKAKHYKDVALSYLFLANNLQHVISKVRTSNLQYLLGEDWISKHEAKVRQFAANYEKLAWEEVLSSLPENPTAQICPEEARLIFRNFNFAFDEAYRKQRTSVVPDPKLRDDIKVSVGQKLVPVYREFYEAHRMTVGGGRSGALYARIAPEDVGNHLSDLFLPPSSLSHRRSH
ncbi:exocyst complex component EXO70H1-like [Pyrus communis]|uniref:exocyst complex component EXO70H1-like n=1 Tax=Pyrus communis TaxID=23211 RepID=UPI0035C11BF0